MKYLSLLLCLCLTSCTSLRTASSQPSLFARIGAWFGTHKAQLGATGSWLARKAAVLAVQTIVNAAQSPQDLRDKSDWIDSMAAGFRTVDKSSLLTADDVKQLAAVWTPNATHWQVLGTQLAASYALSSGPSQQRLEALAVGLQDAAREGRAEAAALTGP